MSLLKAVQDLVRFKQWANEITFSTALALPLIEVDKQRPTRFKTIVNTLNHVYVIDDIFKAHLSGTDHGYKGRNTEVPPTLDTLWAQTAEMDEWYINYCDGLTVDQLNEVVLFSFVDGGEGKMSRSDIIMHIVNHANYHRGFVGDMFYQIPIMPDATDYPVYLRELKSRE